MENCCFRAVTKPPIHAIIKNMGNEKQERRQRALQELGKVLVNFGSLTFASLVLGTIIKGDFDKFLVLIIGGAIAVVFIALGIFTLTKSGGQK